MAGFGQQPPFTNDEKNFVLAEIVKAYAPHHSVLLNVVTQNNYQPKWDEMPLPAGRSVTACRHAFDEMRRNTSMYSPLSSAGGASMTAATAVAKRPLALESAYAGGRTILPKTAPYPYPPSIAEPPAKRKRGRPTKAEQQARAAEQTGLESTAMAGAASSRVQTPQGPSVPTSPGVFQSRTSQQSLPSVSRMLVSTIITPTTAAPPQSASHSGSSSGKRRRRRRSDEPPGGDSNTTYVSPYTRSPLDDTPARPSSSRRRPDEPIHSTVTRLGISDVEQAPGAPSTASPGPYGGAPA